MMSKLIHCLEYTIKLQYDLNQVGILQGNRTKAVVICFNNRAFLESVFSRSWERGEA